MALVIKIITANVRLQRSPQQYCGSRLADIMKVICKSKYNNAQNKRSQMGKSIMDTYIALKTNPKSHCC